MPDRELPSLKAVAPTTFAAHLHSITMVRQNQQHSLNSESFLDPNRNGGSLLIDSKVVAGSAEIVFGHAVTYQWLTGVTEGSPVHSAQESVTVLNNGKHENLVGLGIRHVSQSRFNYALSANSSANFLGDRSPVGLGIWQIPKSRFDYALFANPSADFLGERISIGLGIRQISTSKFNYALSANTISNFVSGGKVLSLPILPEESSDQHYVTLKSLGRVLNASPDLQARKVLFARPRTPETPYSHRSQPPTLLTSLSDILLT